MEHVRSGDGPDERLDRLKGYEAGRVGEGIASGDCGASGNLNWSPMLLSRQLRGGRKRSRDTPDTVPAM